MVSMAHSEQSGMAPTADPRAVRSTGARLPEDLIFAPLLAVVLLAPLPFASNRPWAWSLWAVVIGVLILAWGAQTIRLRREPLLPLERIWPVAVLFAIPIVWAVAQTLPIWPASWSHPLWAIAADTLTTGTRPRISLAPNAAWVTIMRLLTYAGIFWLALQACRVRERARSVLTVFAIGGTVYAAYGLAAFFLTPEAILWFAKEAYRDSVTGPFINRNSFATYVGLTILATVALLARQLFHGMDDGMTKRVWRNILFDNLGKHETWIALAALLITATALLLTQSRAGLASTAAGLLVLLAGLQFGGTVPAASRRAFAAVMVAVFVGLSVLSGSGTVSRLSDSRLQADARVGLFALTIDAIGDSPLLGHGLGAYPDLFQLYRTEAVSRHYTKAHNTYLENAAELGIPAAASLTAAVGGLGVISLFGIRRRRRDTIYPCLGVGATVLVGAHALAGFSLQIPAVAMSYALLMGLACAQSWSSRERSL